jgi:GT2 family glycosyltransferase
MNPSEAGFQPLVSIITLNYNQAAVTAEFLESSKKLLYPSFEILICDMASSEDPANIFNGADYPNTKLLISKKNLGFAGGNNWGIRQARGEFIFIVNNDTDLTPDIIHRLLQPFSQNPSIGVVCPKIKYFDDPHIIQYAGFRPMNPFTGRTSSIGDHETDLGQYDLSGVTNGAHGCAMMIKKEVIEKTGLFPENFFLYYEEWDLSVRVQKAGYLIWYQSEATILHKESMTVGKENPMKTYYLTRNRILYMRRNSNPFNLLVFGLFFILFTTPKTMITCLLTGDFVKLKWFLQGIGYNLFHSSKSNIVW